MNLKPADLPLLQPNLSWLSISLLLATVDEVIE
jgi:hypothetical protein